MTTTKPPVWFWIISILALIWNSMGVNQYLQQAYNTEAFKSMVSTEELEMISQLPTWYTAVFAIAVFAGALGCILLLLRKKLAYFVLLLSLISVLFQMGYITFSMDMANLSNAQQKAVVNAQAFLQMDVANLTNAQQLEVINTQNRQQSMLSDQEGLKVYIHKLLSLICIRYKKRCSFKCIWNEESNPSFTYRVVCNRFGAMDS